jgi:hypothetical protein
MYLICALRIATVQMSQDRLSAQHSIQWLLWIKVAGVWCRYLIFWLLLLPWMNPINSDRIYEIFKFMSRYCMWAVTKVTGLGLNDCSLKFCKRRDVFPLSPSPTLGPTLQALSLRVKQTTHRHQAQRWSGALSPVPLLIAVFGQNVFLLHYINFPPTEKV